MLYITIKTIITALLIVIISEIGKRSNFLGALLASIPLVSVLAMVWLYIDTQNVSEIATMSLSVFWLVLPSLVFFLVFPLLLNYKINFYGSLTIGILIMLLCYYPMIMVLKKFGVKL